jgi:hypothetical protein
VDVLAGGGSTVTISAPMLRQVFAMSLVQATSANRPIFKQSEGLLFDGSADGLINPATLNLTATDELTVVAKVTKYSDAARGLIASLSTSPGANSGIFTMEVPGSPLVGYRSYVKGTIASTVDTGPIAAPDTSTLTIEGKIANDLARLRINDGPWFNGSTDMGSGNFGNYPLFVGMLGNLSAYLNGSVVGLCIFPKLDDDIRELAYEVINNL